MVDEPILSLGRGSTETISNDEILRVLLAIQDSQKQIVILRPEEIEMIRELFKSITIDDIKTIKETVEERKAIGKAWSIFKTILISAAATIVAYNTVFENGTKLIQNIGKWLLGTGGQ